MAIRKVARLGHPVLRNKNKTLTEDEIKSPDIQRLISDMIETMDEYDGIGLAAPQVYENIKLALIGFDTQDSLQYQDAQENPITVFINPTIKVLDKKTLATWEGCLSVPGLRGLVERPRKIRVHYQNAKGEKQTLVAEGVMAVVIQHELDHLDGILYVDKIKDTNLSFCEEYNRYLAPEDSEEEQQQGPA